MAASPRSAARARTASSTGRTKIPRLDMPGEGSLLDRGHDLVDLCIRNHKFDSNLLGATDLLSDSFLDAVAIYLGDHETLMPNQLKGFVDIIHLGRSNDGFDPLHVTSTPSALEQQNTCQNGLWQTYGCYSLLRKE